MEKLSLKLVSNSDESFWQGRRLAKTVYAATWGTQPERISDDYGHGIVLCQGDEVKGNLNIKRRTAGNMLPSEKFFHAHHWEEQCSVEQERVAELCSFAVSDTLTNSERIMVFRGLILGAHLHAVHEGIHLYVTVQRSGLINTLVRLLRYPFFPSVAQTLNEAALPNDTYWQTEPKPQLYYSHTVGAAAYRASFKVLSSFLLSGLTLEEAGKPAAALVRTDQAESVCNA